MRLGEKPISKFVSDVSLSFNYIPRLPKPVSRFLGYRKSPQPAPPEWLKLINILLITMGAMLANFAVAQHAPLYTNYWHFEAFIPSFAASCILIYGSIEAPFSQPRNLVLGHFLSGLIGLCIMKLFMTNPNNEKYLWLSGALSVAVSSVIMEYTGTVHPPSGATAVLPSVDDAVRKLGWNYLPALLIHSLIFLGIAMLCNNFFRQYPKFWIAPPPPKPAPKAGPADAEKQLLRCIVISNEKIDIPVDMALTPAEQEAVHTIQARLKML